MRNKGVWGNEDSTKGKPTSGTDNLVPSNTDAGPYCHEPMIPSAVHTDIRPDMDNIVVSGNVKMKKQVGLYSAVSFIVGSAIGSGIFISPKGVLRGTGSVASSLLVWAGCGVLALTGGLCYIELGLMIPKSGGEFSYLMESLGPIPAFVSVWTLLLMSKTAGQAIISLTFSRYLLSPFFDACGPPELVLKLLAATTLLTVNVVNCYSAKLAARVQLAFMVVKVTALVVIICGGIYTLSQGKVENISAGFDGSTSNPSAIALAFYNGLFAYDAWNTLNYLTEELVNPIANLPRAIYIGVPMVTFIYMLTNVSYLTVMSTEELLASPAVAMTWADRILGPAAILVPLGVAFSTFGALNGSIFTGGRLCFAAAREGLLPQLMSYVHVHHLTPYPSLIISGVVTIAMLIPGDIGRLINFSGFITWTIYGAAFLGLIVMRSTHKHWDRPYKVNIALPVFMLLVSIYLVVAPIADDPQIEILYAAACVFGGLIFYFPFIHLKCQLPFMDSLTMYAQLFLQVAPSKYEPDTE